VAFFATGEALQAYLAYQNPQNTLPCLPRQARAQMMYVMKVLFVFYEK
jgi:hypothetical protein